MGSSDEGKPHTPRSGRPPPRPRRAGVVSDVRASVRFTPDEAASIGMAAGKAGLTWSQFIRQTTLLAAAGTAGAFPAPAPPSIPLQTAAGLLSGAISGPVKGAPTQRVVVELSTPLAEALTFGAKAAKLRKHQVVSAALIFLGLAHLRGLVSEFTEAVAQMQPPDPLLIRRAALAAQVLGKKPRAQWTKADTARGQLTLRAGQIRDFRAGAKIAGLSVSEFMHAVVAAAAKEGPNPPPVDAVNALIKAVRELNSSAVLLNQLMKQIHLIKFRQSDPPDEQEVRAILAGVADTAGAVRSLLADWHPRNPYKR